MTGIIERIPRKNDRPQPFVFIKVTKGREYFLHCSEFKGDWDGMCKMVEMGDRITVEFTGVDSPKGPRAQHAMIANYQD
jgi:cold shock CspA family protein